MKPAWKRGLLGCCAIGAILVGVRVGSTVHAERTLRAYVAAHDSEVADRRATLHTTRLPSLHGPPSAVRCAEAQAPVFREIDRGSPRGYASFVDAWPTTRVPDDARDWVHAAAAHLADLRASLGCSEFLDERGASHWTLPLTSAAHGLIVDGLMHAEDGDASGAVERELDAIRLGEQGGAAIAPRLVADAALALARVIASTASAGSLDETTRALDALAPFVPPATALADEMKLLLPDAARDADPDPVGKLDAPRYEPIQGLQRVKMRLNVLFSPRSVIVADAITELDAQLDRAIEALQSGSSDRASEVEAALVAENAKTANPIVWLTNVPLTIDLGRKSVRATCALAVARAALASERARDASGRYAAPAMPDDPCAHGSPLHWESLAGGAGYRVWSVGTDGKDAGGRADDLAASRAPAE